MVKKLEYTHVAFLGYSVAEDIVTVHENDFTKGNIYKILNNSYEYGVMHYEVETDDPEYNTWIIVGNPTMFLLLDSVAIAMKQMYSFLHEKGNN